MQQKALVIYHKVDYDGIFSSCIARDYFEKQGFIVSPFGYNYGDSFPEFGDLEEFLEPYDFIALVDISLPPEIMKQLKGLSKYIEVHWVDHHITAIQDSIDHGYSDLPGKRDVSKAACELCWEYFFKDSIPTVISYLGRYDIWDKNAYDWDNIVLPLQFALRTEYGVSHKVLWDNKVYEELVYTCGSDLLNKLIEEGKCVLKYLTRTWRSAVSNCSFPVSIDGGKFQGLAIISTELSSNVFKSAADYDIYVVVCIRRNEYRISMYSNKEVTNLGEYMKKNYSGGGHANAAGGTMTREQFIDFITNHKI